MTTDDVIVFVTGNPGLVASLSEPFRLAVQEAGLPTSFSINTKKLLPSKNTSDGKGIDHLFDGGYVDQYVEILLGLLEA